MKPHSYIKRLSSSENADGTWNVPALCQAYGWPKGLAGGGVVGIVELGGGWRQGDIDLFCQKYGVGVPSITDVSVDGTTNTLGTDADVIFQPGFQNSPWSLRAASQYAS